MEKDDEFEQTRFRDGHIIRNSSSGEGRDAVPRPNAAADFAVSIKAGALEVNNPLVRAEEVYGSLMTFASRGQAELFAEQLSALDGRLRIQAAAPNDPADVDAYLLADYDPSITEPASVDGDTLTFDVEANLYGALGEAIITGGSTSHAVEYFVEQDLADVEFRDWLQVHVTDSEHKSFGHRYEGDRSSWLPDCRIEARDGWRGSPVETYWCEIKTGDASFGRTQMAAMRELAREERVLKIRVLIDDLPNQYSVRIHEMDADRE